ncbi:STAS domain-containing protein [Paractinoplanes maris]|uniref:STAS domain-containing protein n=1 Tax=Paractinoplanes maris TaxID=1734446 RepID=UPI00201FE52B|nr:STAS domain-containing protein [Actinoplanes maris]
MPGPQALTWHQEIRDELPTLTVAGTLTVASGEPLHDAAIGFLRQHRAEVMIDLTALTVADESAVLVFGRIVDEALRWPDVLVVVCAPTGEVMRLLSADVLDPRLVFDSVASGRSVALASVPAVSEDLLPISRAARHARRVVTEACLRWDEPDLIGSATLVVSELVSNAAMHAQTMMTMQVRLRPCHVRIAVFDGSALPAVSRSAGTAGGGGRGLLLVDAVSAAWGSTPLPDGKVVWSALARGNGDQ